MHADELKINEALVRRLFGGAVSVVRARLCASPAAPPPADSSV
jgi:hypothetical protein